MSGDWLDANQRHLCAAVDAVRARLAANVDGDGDAAEAPAAEAAAAAIAASMRAPPALDVVASLFGLSGFEREILVLCAGCELDARFRLLLDRVQPMPGPTFGLALAALPGAHWSALAPGAPLRRWHLVELAGGPALTAGQLRIDECVLHRLTGIGCLDPRLEALVEPVDSDGSRLAASHLALVERLAAVWPGGGGHGPAVLELWGPAGDLRREVAAAACARHGLRLHAVSALALPGAGHDLELLARLWERDARLGAGALLVDCDALDRADPAREEAVDRLLGGCAAPLVVSGRGRRRHGIRPMIGVEVAAPPPAEQLAVWRSTLGPLAGPVAGAVDRLVSQFSLTPTQIHDACAQARIELGGARTDPVAAVWDACRGQARFDDAGLAERIEPAATWDDLVLPDPQRRALREIALQTAGRYRVYERWGFARSSRRGLGVSALFTGGSGTGKTMAAEVLASELRLDLYRIDLSQVVSKYVGETEKNLRRVFDAAERGAAILLFDEADALFGKRTEVRDSHDRYANIEVGYLLQRMEAYRGLAILTTNLKDALDAAFLRRIRFTISFPFPDEEQRAAIWRRTFPPAAPTEGLEVARLARLHVAGGSIRNIALNAAFLAAAEDRPIRMVDLLEAARSECAKLHRPLTDAEVGDWV